MRKTLLAALFALAINAYSQDSLRILQYNLLNFGNYSGFCNNSNNNHLVKEEYLKTIISYSNPDIFTVNELSKITAYHDRILNNVLKEAIDDKRYGRAPSVNIAGSNIVNMLYYDTLKLSLKSSKVLQSFVRDVNLYTLYYKKIPISGDTVFINCIVAHLKAGSGVSDEIDRAEMAGNIISQLESTEVQGNYLIMGDFNLYTAQEEAYQILTRGSLTFPFYDPINTEGDWNNNPQFASVHTQSVTSSGNGCQSSGGMDDRFDFILSSPQILNGLEGLRFKPGSYKAIGQDGRHFNQSINSGTNTSVPGNVLDALYRNSDHLPIQISLEVIAEMPGSINELSFNPFDNIRVAIDPEGMTTVSLNSLINHEIEVSVFNLAGQKVFEKLQDITSGYNVVKIPLNKINPGLYLLRLSSSKGYSTTIKLVK